MAARGKLYVIEGGDGSGKATQAELTREYLSQKGKNVLKRSFPRYGEPSAILVERYLNGGFGDLNAVPPEFISLAYAADRLAGTPEIKAHLDASPDNIAVLDRYMGSNVAYQGAKIEDPKKRHEFYKWIQRTEVEDLGMLVPDLNIVLLVPAHVSQQNVASKDKAVRSYTDKTHDLHEANAEYQERVKLAYQELCELFPDRYTPVECMDENGSMRSREDIQADIRKVLGV